MAFNFYIHNRRPIRLPDHDYGSPGLYFVTICTQNRECLFGEVINSEMVLNEIGRIVFNEWLRTPLIRKNVILDEFIIMPNHLHGIIEIIDVEIDVVGIGCTNPRGGDVDAVGIDAINPYGDSHKYGPQSNNLFAIIRGFKGATTKQINTLLVNSNSEREKIWQLRFYDHVIRSEKSLNNIRNYILDNPENWDKDLNNQQFISRLSEKEKRDELKKIYNNLYANRNRGEN